MGKKVTVSLILLSVLLSLLVPLAHAQEPDINLLDFPQKVADYFGISAFAAKYLVSGVALLLVTMLVAFTMKRSASSAILYAVLIVDFVMMAFFVALAWIDYWVFLILCLIVALWMASSLRDLITGK